MRVLIVEDDPELSSLLRDGLRAQRIDATLAATWAEGCERAAGGSFDVMVLDRATITAHVWDDNHDPFANLLDVLVRRLRGKIDDGFEPKLITTLRGSGYRFGR